MPIERREPRQTSISRKLIAYGETYKVKLQQSRYGMENMRVLFITKSPARAESMLRVLRNKVAGEIPRGLFLFTDRASLADHRGRLLELKWQSGIGREVTLF